MILFKEICLPILQNFIIYNNYDLFNSHKFSGVLTDKFWSLNILSKRLIAHTHTHTHTHTHSRCAHKFTFIQNGKIKFYIRIVMYFLIIFLIILFLVTFAKFFYQWWCIIRCPGQWARCISREFVCYRWERGISTVLWIWTINHNHLTPHTYTHTHTAFRAISIRDKCRLIT